MDDAAQRLQWRRRGHSGRRRLLFWVAGIAALAVVGGAAAGPFMSRVEQPEYAVERSDGVIEIRAYGSMIAAEAVVEGKRKAAINEGFRLIAAYIFGANKPNAKIAMTAPVQQQKQTIAMTAPVTQQASGTREASGSAWTVRFIMPRSWTMETLPAPADARVTLKPVPAQRVVALTFSGVATDDAVEKRTAELRRYALDHRLTTTGEPMLAFYNPPWTLPFFRRNEVMLAIAG